jgi:predicted aconitase with swiveling domain
MASDLLRSCWRSRIPILALGALVASELYATEIPVVVLSTDAYAACSAARELTVEVDRGSMRAVVRIVS